MSRLPQQIRVCTLCGVIGFSGACVSDVVLPPAYDDPLSAGRYTVIDDSAEAFGHALPGLDQANERAFFRGRALFRDDWVTAPASTNSRDGLGPLFNARSCIACHVADGRGRPPLADDEALGPMLLRLAGTDPAGGITPDATYGGQLQPFGVAGVMGEATAFVRYSDVNGIYGDGEPFALRQPTFELRDLQYGPLAANTSISARVPPPMIGLGLLESIPAEALAARMDPDDANGDGIAGRLADAAGALGRFGLRGEQPTVAAQSAAAFAGDLGLTSASHPEQPCTPAQAACNQAPNGGAPEIIAAVESDVTAYSSLLAVPARRNIDKPGTRRGALLFEELGCAACHTPTQVTGALSPILPGETIHPYTDLLLHDMGPGLGDQNGGSQHWRTSPLWGVGLTATVNGHELLLHDGRARGFAEAILWHGGEAEPARERFRLLPKGDRDDLVEFLRSL